MKPTEPRPASSRLALISETMAAATCRAADVPYKPSITPAMTTWEKERERFLSKTKRVQVEDGIPSIKLQFVVVVRCCCFALVVDDTGSGR